MTNIYVVPPTVSLCPVLTPAPNHHQTLLSSRSESLPVRAMSSRKLPHSALVHLRGLVRQMVVSVAV